MGAFLSLVKGRNVVEVFIDFENAVPSAEDTETYNKVNDVLSRAPAVLTQLRDYAGCQELARKAMSSPTAANEEEAFEGLLGAVESIQTFYSFTAAIEAVTPTLLLALSTENTSEQFLAHPALVKQLADVLDFALAFDTLRMSRPFLSNDFSYYRRLLPKFNRHPDVKVKDDDASGMAMFTAEHIPMTTAVARAATQSMERNRYVGNTLALMANSCMTMIKQHRFIPSQTNLSIARAMCSAIIVYDHAEPQGAFVRGSPIAVKQCIRTLKKNFHPNNHY